jgi:hypothetical protein
MARQVLPILGGVVGAFFGMPQLGFAIGSVVGQLVDPVVGKGPSLGELPVQTSNEGSPRAIIYGTATCTGYVLAFGPPIKTTETRTGEKGAPKTEEEVVYRSYAVAICEGPIDALIRVWENDKLVYDIRPSSLMAAESAQWMKNKFLHLGGEDQLPDVFMEQTISGVGTTPAYRGTAYIYFNLEDVTDMRGAIKQYRFEVSNTATLSDTLAPLVVFPWTPNSINPLDERNEHTYQYRGFTDQSGNPEPYPQPGSIVTDLSVAVGQAMSEWNAVTGIPPAITALYLIGNSGVIGADTSTMYPAYPSQADQQERILLHYNEIPPTSYVAPEDYPIPDADIPFLSSGEGAWGAQSPRGSVRYIAPTYPHGDQFVSPRRNYATEVFTNSFVGDGSEEFLTYDALIEVVRVPTTAPGFTKVIGTAKQLAAVQYVDGELFQNGLGPVLLPDDPDYDNTEFWDNAREDAITEGTLNPSADSPVVVAAYGFGRSTAFSVPIPLSDIVSDLHARSAIPEEDFDVSELEDDLVKGLTLTGDYSAADAIDTLRSCYFFDKAEPGDKLYYPKRGKQVVMTLDFDDLIDVPDMSKREQVSEVPKKLHLLFQNATAGYAPVKATYERSTVDVQAIGESMIQVPVVLDMDEGQKMVHKQMKVMTADAQGEIKLTLPERLISLVPSDNIGFSIRGQVRRLRINECEWADGVLSPTLRIDRQSAYTSHLTGIPIPEPTLPPSTIVGGTEFVYMDAPSRSDNEDDLHYLVAGTGSLPGWYGWLLQRSLDGGANYASVEQFETADVIGSLVDPVPSASEHYTDTTNTVRVQLHRSGQTIEDITEAQFMSEGGAFLLEKAEGVYEVMQYRDAVDEGDDIFALTVLHRGRLNSGASSHAAGARFVLLSSAHHIPAQSAWIGRPLTHRPVSLGESPELADAQTSAFIGRSQIEWPVAYLTLARDGSDNISASWTPRHRFGTDDSPVASVNFQGYRVTLNDGTAPPITFDTTVASFTYDASALDTPLTVSVSAINRITGAGPATSGSV